MAKYNVEVYRNICPVCDKIYVTTRKRELSHPHCREEYYRMYYKEWNRKNRSGKFTRTRHYMARRTWYVNEHACVVPGCGYSILTRDLTLYDKEGKKTVFKLCPMHLFEYKCGFLDDRTWLRVDKLKEHKIKEDAAILGAAVAKVANRKESTDAQSTGVTETKGDVGADSQPGAKQQV